MSIRRGLEASFAYMAWLEHLFVALSAYRLHAQTAAAPTAHPDQGSIAIGLGRIHAVLQHARPHQNLDGLTPAEKWNGFSKTDVLQQPPKSAVLVTALEGLLVGYCTRR